MLEHADDEARHDVDARDEHRGERVALREADRAVHRAVEVGFAPDPVAPRPRLALVDQSGIQIGVDRHLAAGHRIEGEPRRDFRDANRAVVDDDELNRNQHQEHDHADDEIAADDELAERHDHVAGGVDAFLPVHENQARGRDVERQPHQRQQQQQRREDRKFDRLPHVDDRQQQHDREADVHRQQEVEQQRRQRHHHQQHDGHDGRRRQNLRAAHGYSFRCRIHHYLRAPAA